MAGTNGYSFREAPIPGDAFRIFLSPPGSQTETVEVFKEKSSDAVSCGAGLVMAGGLREKFFAQTSSKRNELRESLENLDAVRSLYFFHIEDDGKNFIVTMRCGFSPNGDVEGSFESCMNRINLAGYSVEEEWDRFFEGI